MSKGAIYTGQTLVELRPERRWSSRGWEEVKRFRGTPDAIERAAAMWPGTATSIEIQPDGNYAELRLTFGMLDDGRDPNASNDQVSTWELEGNDLEKSLWEHPKVKAVLDAKSETDRILTTAELKNAIEAHTAPKDLPGSISGNATLRTFYSCIMKGVEVFSLSQFVLRHNQVVAAGSNIQPSYVNVGKMYTTAGLQAAEAIPATINFALPTGYWLKRTPKVLQLQNGKFQIMTEWWYAESYDVFVYEAVP